MKTFNSLEEMEPYYNEKTNAYEFRENGIWTDVKFAFDLSVVADIKAYNINAKNITVCNIDAYNINAKDLNACTIDAGDINAYNIDAGDINACNINTGEINAGDINAGDINACNIDARDINARNITANEITYFAVCFAYDNIVCTKIEGRRKNAKHFCLDGEIIIKDKPIEMTLEEVCKALGKNIKIVTREEKR
jgi:hypothetical protein